MFQHCAENLVERNVLVRKGILPDGVDVRIVAHIERRNGVKPVACAVFAGLRHESKVSGMLGQQIIKELRLLLPNKLNSGQPLVDHRRFVAFQISGRRHALAVDVEISHIF